MVKRPLKIKIMTRDEKLEYANKYLNDICGISWDDLPDINFIDDAETEDDIRELCRERLEEEGYPYDILNE